MKRRDILDHVQAKLDKFEQAVEHLAQQVARTQDAIDGARQRLTGGFQRDQEYNDLYSSLKQLVADKPILEWKLSAAKHRLSGCREWLDSLPDGTALETIKVVPNGLNLDDLSRRTQDLQEEVNELCSVPVPSSDIERRVKEYVAGLARPKVNGIGGGQLEVLWPSSTAALLALLLPDEMANALMKEIERQSSTPMPLETRKKRIAELNVQIDVLQRQTLALDPETSGLPPEVILGVRAVRGTQVKRVERRVRAA